MTPMEQPGHLSVALRRSTRRERLPISVAVAFVVAVSWSARGDAVGLGPVTQQSALGQSLRLVVPVTASTDENIAAECFKLVPSEREMAGVPQLAFGRISLERTASSAELVITNARPVDDPVLRMTIQAGCESAVRREYVLLMDPPPIDTPLVAAESSRPEATDTSPAQAPPPARTSARASRSSARAGGSTALRGTDDSTRPARKAAAPKPAAPPRAAQKRPARVADQPRLRVSSAAPSVTPDAAGKVPTEADLERAQQERANAIEAETIVLQQRIVELTAMVERMQQEVRANEVAQRAAEEAAKAAPLARAAAWWSANWPLLMAIVVLPLLLAAGLLWRRRQQGDREADAVAARAASIDRNPAPGPPLPAAAPMAAAKHATPVVEAKPRPPRKAIRRPPVASGTDSALAVSELLHATEEARVYVALGHPERAIDALNEHIRKVPRPMPAAWLMLLDLYRTSGRQQDFRRLAEEFHLHCNVQAPLWEGFGSGDTGEGGLETFPHILRQVVEQWHRPECQAYLEALLIDNREGRRMGFPLAAYGDILLLLQIHSAPPAIDIDSDLASAGRLERERPDARPRAAQAEATATLPAQQPLTMELDLGEHARMSAKKPPP